MLATGGHDFLGARVALSGSGNVAQFAAEKVLDLGGLPVTLSDSSGFIYDPDGINREKLAWVKALKNERRGRISEYAEAFPGAVFTAAGAGSLWATPGVTVALPCATQNELGGADAEALVKNGACVAVAEGANMPCSPEAVEIFLEHGILFAPGKASNAGGVATSGLEMSQNSQRLSWSRLEVDRRLEGIMVDIHRTCMETAERFGCPGNYVAGANIAGFLKVADAMLAEGIL